MKLANKRLSLVTISLLVILTSVAYFYIPLYRLEKHVTNVLSTFKGADRALNIATESLTSKYGVHGFNIYLKNPEFRVSLNKKKKAVDNGGLPQQDDYGVAVKFYGNANISKNYFSNTLKINLPSKYELSLYGNGAPGYKVTGETKLNEVSTHVSTNKVLKNVFLGKDIQLLDNLKYKLENFSSKVVNLDFISLNKLELSFYELDVMSLLDSGKANVSGSINLENLKYHSEVEKAFKLEQNSVREKLREFFFINKKDRFDSLKQLSFGFESRFTDDKESTLEVELKDFVFENQFGKDVVKSIKYSGTYNGKELTRVSMDLGGAKNFPNIKNSKKLHSMAQSSILEIVAENMLIPTYGYSNAAYTAATINSDGYALLPFFLRDDFTKLSFKLFGEIPQAQSSLKFAMQQKESKKQLPDLELDTFIKYFDVSGKNTSTVNIKGSNNNLDLGIGFNDPKSSLNWWTDYFQEVLDTASKYGMFTNEYTVKQGCKEDFVKYIQSLMVTQNDTQTLRLTGDFDLPKFKFKFKVGDQDAFAVAAKLEEMGSRCFEAKPNTISRLEFIKKEADDGGILANYLYGAHILLKSKVNYELAKSSIPYLDKAASAGFLPAYSLLGNTVAMSFSKPIYSDRNAVHYLKLAANSGDELSMNTLGVLYATGKHGLEKNLTEANFWFTRASKINQDAVYNLESLKTGAHAYLVKTHTEYAVFYGDYTAKSLERGVDLMGTSGASGKQVFFYPIGHPLAIPSEHRVKAKQVYEKRGFTVTLPEDLDS